MVVFLYLIDWENKKIEIVQIDTMYDSEPLVQKKESFMCPNCDNYKLTFKLGDEIK